MRHFKQGAGQGNRILVSEHQEQVVFVPSGAFALGRHASL